jgi:2-oxoglutarate dehydrogenase E2 component (dihydrolipoamide succinyltransferase)
MEVGNVGKRHHVPIIRGYRPQSILNPPQSAILGMHKIQDRPVAIDGQVVIRPMMYLALSYDHRIVDGKEAVQFLVKIKGLIEDPTRLLLGV